MGKYEVTQAQYKSVMAGQKVTVGGTEYILADSPSYCVQGSTSYKVDNDNVKNGYRLPTEAEWEYAARGGDPTKPDWNYTFSGANKTEGTSYSASKNAELDSVGWYCYNNITGTSGDSDVTISADGCGTHEVGKKTANALGIYDMSGNVWEWCYDWYGSTSSETVTDFAGASSGDNRVRRGGSWNDNANSASVSFRYNRNPISQYNNTGFRVCRNAN